jgi:c-di-GMP-binding flagellar brake protein YcgR
MEDKKTGHHGSIAAKEDLALTVNLKDKEIVFPDGKRIAVYLKQKQDTYYFTPDVLFSAPGELQLSHPKKIYKVQRRKFYRREVDQPVLVRRSGETSFASSTMLDLGGGGTSLINPGNAYRTKEKIFLVIKIPHRESIDVSGKIVRTSEEGKHLHIQFDPMKEYERDRILKHIFRE